MRYPSAEKQLIYAVTGRKVRAAACRRTSAAWCRMSALRLPTDAVCRAKPLYERVTTVTGTPLVSPGNWRFRVGDYADAIKLAGGVKEGPIKIVSGGDDGHGCLLTGYSGH